MRRLVGFVIVIVFAIPMLVHQAAGQSPTATPDLLIEPNSTDAATLAATSSLNLDDLRDADGKPFPQPIEDRGTLSNGQTANEDPGAQRQSYLYHVDARAGDRLSFSMIGAPKLQSILALLDSVTGKALKMIATPPGGVMALLDYDVQQDGSFLVIATYASDDYGITDGGNAAFILTYTLFQGNSGGVSVASGFVTPTDMPSLTPNPTILPSDTSLPTITPRATLTVAPTSTPSATSNILPNGSQLAGDIAAGQTQNGTLDDNTPFLAYRFQGKAGEHILVTMDATLQPTLALYDGNFQLLNAAGPRNGETKITLEFDITQPGTYYIVTSRARTERGSGTFSIKLQVGLTGSVQAARRQPMF